jgi:predicted glycogen debranching enzyme
MELTPDDWRDVNGLLDREWLVTNGLGGWASASLAGANTRRYHGLLVAAVAPPTERVVLLSKIDEELTVNGQVYQLGVNEWSRDVVDPRGDYYLIKFVHNYYSVEFHYRLDNLTLVKTVWMIYGHNITCINYSLFGPDGAEAELLVKPFITVKNYHLEARGNAQLRWNTEPLPDTGYVYRYEGSEPELYLQLETGKGWRSEPSNLWYWNFYHRAEDERGLDHLEDLFGPHVFKVNLKSGEQAAFLAATRPLPQMNFSSSLEIQRARFSTVQGFDWLENCLTAAVDQFIVARPSVEKVLPPGSTGLTVIAGYHWFTDWGRDTMIALPGLTLATGRYSEAACILRTFAVYLDRGMLPNRFPDGAEQPEYNTVDATLWFFQAIYLYYKASGDLLLVQELFSKLAEVIEWHRRGTRYSIKVDAADSLLHAGEKGVQLTWMDVKIGDWVVTPRHGKPVEINALWCNALGVMAEFSRLLEQEKLSKEYAEAHRKATESFVQKFWYPEGRYLYDVIDSADGDGQNIDAQGRDSSLRPNQLFAVSLPFGPLSDLKDPRLLDKAEGVVRNCELELLTPAGLRTLTYADPRYTGKFTGNQAQRDAAYHNGTVWPWLLGAFVEAHLKVFQDKTRARKILEPWLNLLKDGGVGSINEVYDGDAPQRPLGCIAQAWSVAEVLRAWQLVK